MPTGPEHQRFVFIEMNEEGHETRYLEDCRCTLSADHDDGGGGGQLSVDDTADIWLSNGMDEDYTFGYSEDKLRAASFD